MQIWCAVNERDAVPLILDFPIINLLHISFNLEKKIVGEEKDQIMIETTLHRHGR